MEARVGDDPNRAVLDALANDAEAADAPVDAQVRIPSPGRVDRRRRARHAGELRELLRRNACGRRAHLRRARGTTRRSSASARSSRGDAPSASTPARCSPAAAPSTASPSRSRPMARTVTVAAVQCPLGGSRAENIARVEAHVREAAARGARSRPAAGALRGPVLLPRGEARVVRPRAPSGGRRGGRPDARRRARARRRHPRVVLRARRAGLLQQPSPSSTPTATVLGIYRKSHIPDGPGYEEKFYFRPGDTGFRVWKTKHATIGVGICWDQWFPESARAMMLLGAEVLFYPTAIGSEPHDPDLDTRDPWQRAMIGPRRLERRPRRRGQPHRGTRAGRSSTARRSSPTRAATRWRSSVGPTRGWWWPPFDLDGPREDARVLGLLPRPAARAVRRVDDRRTAAAPSRRLRCEAACAPA